MLNRRFMLSSLAAVLAAGLATATPAAADALDDIKARGSIIVAIDPTFPPFEFTDAAGKVVGYDPELIEAVAAGMGVKVEYKVMAFSGIIPGLIAGAFDMTPTLNVTAERAAKIDYAIPTAASVNAVLTLKETAVKSSAIEDLAGLKCAVKATTQPEQMMTTLNDELEAKGAKPVELLGFETIEQTIAALADKRVDCVVDDKSVLVEAINKRADLPLALAGEIGGSQPIAWGVNKANPKLTAALSDGLKALKASGKMAELQTKYFGYTTDLPETDFVPK
ncbi:transporter substrate-binding domain-containing protein [Chthonobacter albigriseus]|uniref:transporter substrate-binding domain-containing protein n=1 Tax=Chthonobacter albigriseus TaxID=1683161 RepID=UPI0015EEB6EC|nr:transporter substrate-binding domain-containing protein [Chthonobacter albigriseus]